MAGVSATTHDGSISQQAMAPVRGGGDSDEVPARRDEQRRWRQFLIVVRMFVRTVRVVVRLM